MIKGVIMDLDGTLLDSMQIWDTIAEKYLISEGYTPTEALSKIISSMSMIQACELMRTEYKIDLTAEEIMKGIVETAADFYRYTIPLKPGVAEYLEMLSEDGIKICAATANERALAETALERGGVLSYFSKIFSCNELNCSKEEPTIYLEAARFMGLEKDEVMVFEDSLHALTTAKNAGFHTAAVYDAHEKEQEKMKSTADIYLESFGGIKRNRPLLQK